MCAKFREDIHTARVPVLLDRLRENDSVRRRAVFALRMKLPRKYTGGTRSRTYLSTSSVV